MSDDNLTRLLDALTDTGVYVIEEATHRLLYFNRRCRDMGRGVAQLGVECHRVWPEVCANCPIEALKDGDSSHIVCYDPLQKATVDVTADRILWDGKTRAIVVTARPHRLNYEEELGLVKIERMYASSLLTVFNECLIVNLSRDSYVNCQTDSLWTGIPQRGVFSTTNRIYAEKVIHPHDLAAFREAFSPEAMTAQFSEGKKQITRRFRRRTEDGAYHMAEFTAARIEEMGDADRWCVLVYRDVQEDYLAEQQRNVEISQLATAARIAYQMLIAVNLTSNTYHFLEYARDPIPRPAESGCFDDLIATELLTVHPDYRQEFIGKFSREALTAFFNGGERIVTMEVPHLGTDGVYHWNFTQVVWVESSYTDDLIEITLSRNIDEERRLQAEALKTERQSKQLLEEALSQAERASLAKSDFLSRMSHDIRTPLNAILGMTELALRNPDSPKTEEYLDEIARSGQHLLSLINEVLDVSKIESGTVVLTEEAFDLRALAAEAAELVKLPIEEKKQTLVVDIDRDLAASVRGDARRLKQVLVNLLENACKYTDEHGRISLRIKELKKHEADVGTYQFIFRDNGIGIEADYLEHIFEPFSRAGDTRLGKTGGTGLGMTIVKNLVEMMGGDIRVESEYGKGSRFTVTICFKKCADVPRAKPAKINAAQQLFPELRVLLTEDNDLNRQIAGEMLRLLGANFEVAKNGREAVDAVLGHPPLYYDIVLMDIQMPILNGYEATAQIRGSGMPRIDELPIIALTADAFAEDEKKARLSGMNGHLAKPISVERLRTVLAECLAWKRSRQSTAADPAPADPAP